MSVNLETLALAKNYTNKSVLGAGAIQGATYTPSIDTQGNLSWTNDNDLPNPKTINIKGVDGKEVQLRTYEGYIQWKLDTDTNWNNLISLAELKGKDGNTVNLIDDISISTDKVYSSKKIDADYVKNTSLGVNDGVATLDQNGKLETSQLPGGIDGVIEGKMNTEKTEFTPTGNSIPISPLTNKIYVDIDTNISYRWGGTIYVSLSSGIALGITSATAYRGDLGKTAYEHSQLKTGNPHGVSKSDISLNNVSNDKQVKGLAVGTTENNVVVFGSDGYTIKDSGFTLGKTVPPDAIFKYDKATVTSDGLMSKEDKAKLDKAESGSGGGISNELQVIYTVSMFDGTSLDGSTLTVNGVAYPLNGISDNITIVGESGTVLVATLSSKVGYVAKEINNYTIDESVPLKLISATYLKPTILGYYFGENQSDPAVTWYGDCVGFTAEIASTIDSVVINNFDNVFPFNQFEEVKIGSDIMIKIPKFYHKHITPTDTIDGKTGQVGDLISGIQIDGSWTIHDAFRKGNGIGYNDYVYISKYETSNNNQSVSGATVQTTQTHATFRNNARAKGSGWSQLEFTTWNLQQILMTLVLKTRDSQLKMKGNYSGAVKPTGLTNVAKSTCLQLGNTASNFYGIENPFGNVRKWCDGLNFSGGQIYCCYDISKFADDTATNYVRVGYDKIQTSGYISKLGHDSSHETISLPTAVIGSTSTYYCDYYSQSTGWKVPLVGGYWYDSADLGVFFWYCDTSASYSYANIGSRLVLKPI